ncbi:protein Gawky [Parasteatoda tepidariorum]|uniref:protein Gawky n=1 Tax=Parasteatoda tepidariorum TaxID=114398 RepID=UPI00077F8AFB|nr:protein Gawky [Parasteatoda tepidariorum]
MQTTVHTMETAARYNSNDATSSHSGGSSFSGGTGVYRSNGPHNESTRVLNQNPSYGAQFNSSEKSKCQNYGCENDSNSESPYSWQNMNTSVNSSNNWNDAKPVIGRSIHGGRDSSAPKEDNIVDNENSFPGILGAGSADNYTDEKSANGNNSFNANNQRSMQMPRLGLLGGGEGSMGTANWNANQGQTNAAWGGNRQNSGDISGGSNPDNFAGTPTNKPPQGSWAQAAGKGLNPPCSTSGAPIPSDSSSMQQDLPPTARDLAEKEAKDLRVKAAFSEGWGVVPINQDTPWDVPDPPVESGKDNPPPAPSQVWRAPVNQGTEIWENNLRVNKGSGTLTVPPPTTNVPPWGHTPATNIGGHWGDDDSSSSTWSGPPNTNPNSANWSDPNPASGGNNSGNMWGNSAPTEKHWSGNPSWADGACPTPDLSSWNNGRGRPSANWSPMATPKKEMPPSGWEPPAASPPPNRRAVGSNYDDGTAVWGNPQRQGKVSHWKDMPSAKPIINSAGPMVGANGMLPNMSNMPPSGPGMIRIPGSNKVDATWKQQPSLGRNSNWQDMPPHRDSPNMCNWSEDGNQMKNYGNNHGGSYGNSWNDQSGNMGWVSKPKSNAANWADGQVDTSSWLGPAKQRTEPMWSSENDSKKDVVGNRPISDHLSQKIKGGKPLCKDIVHASKAFRLLSELGYRKEDVENALRNHNMDFSLALTELQALGQAAMDLDNIAGGRKLRGNNMYDDVPMPDHNIDSFNPDNLHGPNNFQSAINFPGMGHNFKQPPPKGPNNNLINSALNGQQLQSGNISPAILQKLLQQQQQQQQSLQMLNLNNIQGFGNSKFNNNAQLRHLCQQIQMAVSAGHLNAQILNQPLSPQTLQLLYQLLQQIKALAGLQNQLLQATSHGSKQGNNNAAVLQINVHIAQTKSRIATLQNQICVHQAQFMKQQLAQQQPNLTPHHGTQSSMDIFKPNVDPMSGLQADFRDISIKDMSHQNHQSRLNQWKLSSLEKDENQMIDPLGNSGDFSRAPGPITSKQGTNSGSLMHPLLEQPDNTWSGLGGRGESSWPDPASSSDSTNVPNSTSLSTLGSGQTAENKDGSHSATVSTSTTNSSTYNLTDLVPEFEPGKPWKGTQLKNIEDDPHITPGSIARSPLSVNNIKESNLFWPPKSSPANSDGVGNLPTNTWMYSAPPVGTPNSSSANLKPGNGKSSWSSEIGTTNDLWGSMPNKNSRNSAPQGISNPGWERQYNSTFLLLRNLTPQIDGSTLKTLCMQHGPLQMFHLFLNRGVALVRYSSREEATKAQSALNNCVLGNTTMLADIPNESEIQQYLQVASGQSSGGGAGGNSWPPSQSNSGSSSYQSSGGSSNTYYGNSNNGSSGGNWNSNAPTSQLWSFSNSSLWGSSQSSNDHDASTNPINSYLPNDLLGGEPM